MSKYTKQLYQKCTNPDCLKAFCRQLPDDKTVSEVSKILSKYGDIFLCRKLHKLDCEFSQPSRNLIIDSMLYINELFFEKSNSEPLSTSFDLKSQKLSKKSAVAENTKSLSQPSITPSTDLEHRFCEILSSSLSIVDSYLLCGMLHFLLNKTKTNIDFNISLMIVRLFNKMIESDDIDPTMYTQLEFIFSNIAEKILNSVITTFLKHREGCVHLKCLLYLDFTIEDFKESLENIKNLIENSPSTDFRENQRLNILFRILKCLFEINQKFGIVETENFILKKFFSSINIKNEMKFSKLKFDSPLNYTFAIPVYIKSEILKTSHSESMKTSLQDAFFKALFEGITQPYLFINIRRDRIYSDTLKIVSEINPNDLKKQLKVKFMGEEGIDSGGIKKEYFLLVGHEIENDISTFVQTNNRIWFRKDVDLGILRIIGRIVGIALYNDVVLSVPFPTLLFKKLLSIEISLDDLEEIEPEIYNSLVNLRKCTEEDLEFLDQNFTADIEIHGRKMNFDLKPNGKNIKVTKENVDEFIETYSRFLMVDAIDSEFNAFSEGFYSIITYENVRQMTPYDLEKILMGIEGLDFESIKNTTTYEGYQPTDAVVEYFWEFFYEMKPQRKKKLIQFITGNDRLPVGGTRALNLIIIKNGCDTDRMPSSQTCFNTLLLPEYSSKEKLREKLGKAIDMTAGFFLM